MISQETTVRLEMLSDRIAEYLGLSESKRTAITNILIEDLSDTLTAYDIMEASEDEDRWVDYEEHYN